MTRLTTLVAGGICRLNRSSPVHRCPFDFGASGGGVPLPADHPLTVRQTIPVPVHFPDVPEGADAPEL